MDDAQWERVAAGLGIVFVVLLVVSSALLGAPPKESDPILKIAKYVDGHHSGILWSTYLSGLATFVGILFAGAQRSFMRRAEGGSGRVSAVLFGGALVAAALFFLNSIVTDALAFHGPRASNPGTFRFGWDLAGLIASAGWFPLAVWIGAFSIVTMRTRVLPMWFGQAGAVVALIALVAGLGVAVTSDFFAFGGGVSLIAFILFGLWALASSILIVRRIGKPAMMQTTA